MNAQVSADEASKDFLALHCAKSAGSTQEQFREYGRKLSLTLAALGPEQQRRVFGYLPTPGVVSSGPVPPVEDSNSEEAGKEVSTAPSESLFDQMVEGASSMLEEILMLEPINGAVIAGPPPATEAGNPTDFDENAESEDDGNNGHGSSGGFDPSNPGKSGKKPKGQAKK